MKKNILYGCLLLLPFVFAACDDDEPDGVRVQSFQVWNDERAALSARVIVTLTQAAPLSVQYWKAGENESDAPATPLSSVKTEHDLPLYKLEESTTYHFRFVVGDDHTPLGETQTFTTAAIPAAVKEFYNEAENEIDDATGGYYIFHNMAKPGCIYVVDNTGRLVWYRTTPNMIKSARFTADHTLITLQDDNDNPFGDANVILETTLAGDTLFAIRKGEQGFDQMAHHDVQRSSSGNLVVVTNVYQDGLPGDGIIVLNRQGQKIWDWNTFEEITDIDISTYAQPWINSLTIDADGHYIVSLRALCQVWKIHAGTGDVLWKLGKNGNVTMNGDDGQFMFQHFAHRNRAGEIMLFDNGAAARPSSRALSFSINEDTREATVKINTFLPDNLYSMIMGSAYFLPDDNLLFASAVKGNIVKMDKSGAVLWTLHTSKQIFRVEYVEDPFDLN